MKRYRERESGRRMTRRRFKGGKGRENWVYHRQTRRGSRVYQGWNWVEFVDRCDSRNRYAPLPGEKCQSARCGGGRKGLVQFAKCWEEPCLKKFVWWMFWQLRGNALKGTHDATRALVDSSLKTFEERVRDFALGILKIVKRRVECIHVS